MLRANSMISYFSEGCVGIPSAVVQEYNHKFTRAVAPVKGHRLSGLQVETNKFKQSRECNLCTS